jgi:hypothetical protein
MRRGFLFPMKIEVATVILRIIFHHACIPVTGGCTEP